LVAVGINDTLMFMIIIYLYTNLHTYFYIFINQNNLFKILIKVEAKYIR